MKYSYFILIFALIAFSCQTENNPEKAHNPLKVNFAVVQEHNGAKPIYSTGILQKDNQVKLSFKIGGIISEINVQEGDYVSKNQVLAKLNDQEITAKVQQAKAALEKAKRDFQRAENLYNDSVATKEQYQDSRTALDVAQADYNTVVFNQKHAVIKAPENGVVLYQLAEKDEIIAPGHPLFVLGSGKSEYIIQSNVTDKAYVNIKKGDTATIRLDAYKNESFSAFITHISPVADPVTGTYDIELNFKQKPAKLAVGMITKVELFPATKKSLMQIPVDALLKAEGTKGYVFVAQDESVVRKRIEIAHFDSDYIYVQSGLNVNDKVITNGKQKLDEGEMVKLIDN